MMGAAAQSAIFHQGHVHLVLMGAMVDTAPELCMNSGLDCVT